MAMPIAAMKAYAAAQKVLEPGPAQASATAGPSFNQILQSTIGDAAAASRNAESKMTAHAAGRAELVDVVTAVSSAEASLETVIAVRDQVISAYQEIMRMPI
jgi:flagellar hook-basal body complex protein FliE